MELAPDVKSQTERALQNMVNVLKASGSSVDKVVKVRSEFFFHVFDFRK